MSAQKASETLKERDLPNWGSVYSDNDLIRTLGPAVMVCDMAHT
jgi:hypothetical protein